MRPKSVAFKKYLYWRKDLLENRKKTEWYWDESEEFILEHLDFWWLCLNTKEIKALRKQGSWKFKRP